VAGSFNAQDVANTLWAYATMGRAPGAGVMRGLEGRAEAVAGTFIAQDVANTLWAYATLGREPGAGLMRGLEGRAEVLVGTFDDQNVSNTLWAYATLARVPGVGLMRGLEGRGEALAFSLNGQDVANILWAVAVFSTLGVSQQRSRLVHMVLQRLLSGGMFASFDTRRLCQLHQFLVACRLEVKLGVEWYRAVLNEVPALPATCHWEFVREETASSVSQRQVSETLRRMGLSVEDEVRCPTSGYSIDMLVHHSGGGTWAVEFDGPSHFLASRAPKGSTLLKRRHLQLLGYALVCLPYWEWAACRGAREKEQYLMSKLV